MKHLLNIFLAAFVLFAATEVLSQEGNTTTTTNADSTEIDTQDVEGTNGTEIPSSSENETPTSSEKENTSANETSPTTSGGTDNSTDSSGGTPAATNVVPVPTLSEDCVMVLRTCQNNESTCSDVEDIIACLNAGITEGNMTYTCETADTKKVNEYCFSYEMLSQAQMTTVSTSCESRVVEVSQAKVSTVLDYTHTCQFFEDFKDDFTMAATTGSSLCTPSEFEEVRTQLCFACRGAMTSLLLVLVMVAAQRLVTWY